MKCLKCSAETENTLQFCRSCGLALTSEAFKKAGLTQKTRWITFLGVLNYMAFGIYILYAIWFLIIGYDEDLDDVAFALFVVSVFFAFISFICAFGLWHLKSYGRTIQLVLAFIWLLGIPIGTILGILALRHLFKPEVKKLFTEPQLKDLAQEEIMKIAVQAKRKPKLAVTIAVIFIFGFISTDLLDALLIPNAITAIHKSKQKTTMKDITVISTAIVNYVTDKGVAPTQDGTYSKTSEFYKKLAPFATTVLPIYDQWGNNFRVYCGKACNRKYGIPRSSKDDFIVVSLGRYGTGELWYFDARNPKSGLFAITMAYDFDKDLVMWNGYWIRAPRVAVR